MNDFLFLEYVGLLNNIGLVTHVCLDGRTGIKLSGRCGKISDQERQTYGNKESKENDLSIALVIESAKFPYDSLDCQAVLGAAEFCVVVSEEAVAVVIVYCEMRRTICIEPEKSLAGLIQCKVNENAYAGVVLKRNGLYAAHVEVFSEFLLIIIGIGISFALVSRGNDYNVDILLLGQELCCIRDLVEFLISKDIGIVHYLYMLGWRQVHEDIERNAHDDDADKRDTHAHGSSVELTEYGESLLILAVVILDQCVINFSTHPQMNPLMKSPRMNLVITARIAKTIKKNIILLTGLTGTVPATSPVCPFMAK